MCRWQNDLLSGNSEQKCGTWDGGSGSGHCQYSWPSFFSTTESGSKVNSNIAQNFTSLQRKLRGSSWISWIHQHQQQPSCFHCSLLGKGAGVESCEYFLENWFPISVTGFVCRKKCCFCKLKPWSRRSSSSRRDQWQSTLWTMTRRSFVRLAQTFWETTLQQTTREHLRNWLFPLHLRAISGNLSGRDLKNKSLILGWFRSRWDTRKVSRRWFTGSSSAQQPDSSSRTSSPTLMPASSSTTTSLSWTTLPASGTDLRSSQLKPPWLWLLWKPIMACGWWEFWELLKINFLHWL